MLLQAHFKIINLESIPIHGYNNSFSSSNQTSAHKLKNVQTLLQFKMYCSGGL